MKINIEVDDIAVRHAFNRLLAAGSDLSLLLIDIGERLQTTTKGRFDEQKSPDGDSWAPLSPVTIARKKKNKDKILIQDRYLRDLINYQISGNTLLIGSSRIYASTHQFGADKGAFGKTKRGASIPWGAYRRVHFWGSLMMTGLRYKISCLISLMTLRLAHCRIPIPLYLNKSRRIPLNY